MLQRITRLSKNYSLLAVDTDDTHLVGALRMCGRCSSSSITSIARAKVTRVRGITGLFSVDRSRNEVFFDTGDHQLFFLGSLLALQANYYRHDLPFSTDDFLRYQTEYYGDSRIRQYRNSFHIPLDDLRLGTSQRTLLDHLKLDAESQLSTLLSGLERCTVSKQPYRRTGKALRFVPYGIRQLVFQKGHYYCSPVQRSHGTTTETLELPPLHTISTPMGGLPT